MNIPTDRQKTMIVNNVVKACKNIKSLNKTGYNFIYLASGFIAHYNLGGFIDHYSRSYYTLADDIKAFAHQNQWKNFHPGDKDYEYYMAKREIYNRILEEI